jgi:hypothetical protein
MADTGLHEAVAAPGVKPTVAVSFSSVLIDQPMDDLCCADAVCLWQPNGGWFGLASDGSRCKRV